MSGCDDGLEDGNEVVDNHKEKLLKMKKIMSLMLGMSLVLGAASYAFAQDTSKDKKESKKKSGKKKGGDKDSKDKKGS